MTEKTVAVFVCQTDIGLLYCCEVLLFVHGLIMSTGDHSCKKTKFQL